MKLLNFNKHPRAKLLRPTCGVGGHCLAVEPMVLRGRISWKKQNYLKTARSSMIKPQEAIERSRKDGTMYA